MGATLESRPGVIVDIADQLRTVSWGPAILSQWSRIVVRSTVTDAGNTPTTILRSGLLLARSEADGIYDAYAAATTGVRTLVVLLQDLPMYDAFGTADDRNALVMIAGPVKASALINLDSAARAKMFRQFLFDDDLPGNGSTTDISAVVAKATSYTVVAADRGTLFTTTGASGAVTFTLPALSAVGGGFSVTFLNTVDQNMTITRAGSDVIVADGNLTASSVAFSTSSHKIGAKVRLYTIGAGSVWYVENLSIGTTMTVS